MATMNKKVKIVLGTTAMTAALLTTPVWMNGTFAKDPAVKVETDDTITNKKEHFQKGKLDKVKLLTEGNKTVLTPDETGSGTFTSPVLKSKINFNYAMVYWKNIETDPLHASEHFDIEVRYSKDGDEWSEWDTALIDSEQGPFGNPEKKVYTQLVNTGLSKYFQYRIKLKSADPLEAEETHEHELETPKKGSTVKKKEQTKLPASEAPASEAPASEAPASEAPASEAPKSEIPASEAPASETPTSEAPKSEAPKSEAPKSEAPKSEAPASEAPASETPTSETPTSEAPKSETPTSETPSEEQKGTIKPAPTQEKKADKTNTSTETTKKKVEVPKIADLQVAFYNSTDGTEDHSDDSWWDSIVDFFSDIDVFGAEDRPEIVSRADWGADESIRFENEVEKWPREYHPVTHLFVHHTDIAAKDTSPEEVKAAMRAIYVSHALSKKWGDIGYNAIIGPDGKVYEGRKGKDGEVLTNDVVGGGTYAFNKGGYSISMMGNYDKTSLPKIMNDKLVEMLAYEAKVHNIDPLGTSDFVRDYEITDPNVPKVSYNVRNISGHRDTKATICPGQILYNDLPNIRQEVSTLMKANASIKRLAGASRLQTSAAISQEISSLGINSDTVVIARGDSFPDALAAGPLAAKSKAPIILTDPRTLKPETQAEITRRNPSKAIILGGTGAVSAEIESQLKGLGIAEVTRIAGMDRFDVAGQVAEQVVSNAATPVDSAFIALGTNFPDALSVTSIAGQRGMPILLTYKDKIPASIQSFIQAHPEIKKFYLIGGPAVITDGVKAALEATGATTERLYGANRFETAVNVTKHFNMTASSIVFANGANFPDALSGGPLAAYTQSPILLVSSTSVPASVDAYLTSKEGEFKSGYVLGGTGAVSNTVRTNIGLHVK